MFKNYVIFLLIILFSGSAAANILDGGIADKLEWENKALAATLSDVTLIGTIGASFAHALTSKDKRKERVLIAAYSHAANLALTELSKGFFERTRPNTTDKRSFWSGHTSTAFTSAGLVCFQDNARKKYYCGAALGLASLTGYLRMAARFHWFSDVVIGAGVGLLNGKVYPTFVVGF